MDRDRRRGRQTTRPRFRCMENPFINQARFPFEWRVDHQSGSLHISMMPVTGLLY